MEWFQSLQTIFEDYSDEKIRIAVQRAKELQSDSSEKYPKEYGTHVFKIIDEILTVIPQVERNNMVVES